MDFQVSPYKGCQIRLTTTSFFTFAHQHVRYAANRSLILKN